MAQSIDFARFLSTPLTGQLLGVELLASIYARNGFRFIGTLANVGQPQLESELQKFRNIYRLSPASAVNSIIQTGYEQHLPLDHIEEELSRLHDPRKRIICELFWPHLNENVLNLFKIEKQIASPTIIHTLEKTLQEANGKDENIFIKHALAISYHNLAITKELAYLHDHTEWNDNDWLNALIHWKAVHESDYFWDYLRKRAKQFDDPRLKASDINVVREKLPAILLGFNTLFASAYAKAGEAAASANHISLVLVCDFPEPVKQQTLSSLVKTIIHARLEPLIHRVETQLLNISGRYSRKKFEQVCNSVLAEASAVRDYLFQELQLPPEIVEKAEFDRLCAKIIDGFDKKIDYTTDDRERDILYIIVAQKKMLTWPLSPIMRSKLEQARRSDIEILYGEFMPSTKDFDPSRCWFADEEEADPDVSIILPVYKITHREVQVDKYAGKAGISVKYNRPKILVPRSRYAAGEHPKHSRKEIKKSANITNQKAHNWARFFAFLSGFVDSGWSVIYLLNLIIPGIWPVGSAWSPLLTIGLVFLLRRIILRHIDNRGESLPVGRLCVLGLISSFLVWTFLFSGAISAEVWPVVNIVLGVLGIGSIIGFGRAAHLAFKVAVEKQTALPVKPLETGAAKKKVKSYSDAQKFPAYKNAKSAGYQDGTQPSQAEMQMTYAEEQEARRRLGGYYY